MNGALTGMDAMAWIALGGLSFTVISTVYAAIAAGFRRVSATFAEHDLEDQKRHTENVERFARIETQLGIIIRNGNPH